MMKGLKIAIRRKKLVKAAMALTGLLFFIPQFSPEFYWWAAPSSIARAHLTTETRLPVTRADHSLPLHERGRHAHVDKRYTLKHVFCLSTLLLIQFEPQLMAPVMSGIQNPVVSKVGLANRPLRGPPAAPFSSLLG